MRRFTLLIAIAVLSTVTMAQKQTLIEGEKASKGFAAEQTQRGAKDATVYWSEDFDGDRWMSSVLQDGDGYLFDQDMALPAAINNGGQWTTAANGELTTNRDAMYFHWSDVGPRGRWSANYTADNQLGSFEPNNDDIDALPDGTSVENGFIILEGDLANTTESGVMPAGDLVFDMDSYIQCGPIDLSAAPGAIFNLKTYYRYCCTSNSTLALEVSVDYDAADPTAANWGVFRLNNTTGVNDVTFQNQVHFNASERDMSVNISRMMIDSNYVAIAGSNNVYIRLHQTLASHYFWMIDDLSITEPATKDLLLTDGFADYMYDAEVVNNDPYTSATNFYGGYTVIPEAVAGEFIKFRAGVVNNGLEDITGAKATVSITRGDEVVYTKEGVNSSDLAKFEYDTLKVLTSYVPAEAGNYRALISSTVEGGDGDTGNNEWKYDFKVGGNVWSRVYRGNEDRFNGAGARDFVDGGLDGDACVQEYVIPAGAGQQRVYGINTFINSHRGRDSELSAIENAEVAIYARVWVYDAALEKFKQSSLASSLRTIRIEDTASWITIPFIDDGTLFLEEEDIYRVGIEIYTGNKDTRFMIGKDMLGPKQPLGGGFCYLSGNDSWAITEDNYAIELIMGETYVEPVKLTMNFDFTCDTTLGGLFDRELDTIFVTGSWSGWAEPGSIESTRLYRTTTRGIYTATVQGVAPSMDHEYKYFVGSGWDNGLSANNLTVTVGEEAQVQDDLFDCGSSVETAQMNAIEVYPNPFKNTLTITNTNNVAKITISNIVGQLVREISVDQADVEISTADLEAGIYVISVTDANNNTKSQRVVKQ